MALKSAHWIHTLSKIELNNINQYVDRIKININKFIKTSGINRKQPGLIFPYFKENPTLCIASFLFFYIGLTSNFRYENTLIYTYQKSYHPASTQTLRRWIKEIRLLTSGVKNIFGSHSVRHATTSQAFRAGLNIDLILTTAGCSKNSSVFNTFYNKLTIANRTDFAKSILSRK